MTVDSSWRKKRKKTKTRRARETQTEKERGKEGVRTQLVLKLKLCKRHPSILYSSCSDSLCTLRVCEETSSKLQRPPYLIINHDILGWGLLPYIQVDGVCDWCKLLSLILNSTHGHNFNRQLLPGNRPFLVPTQDRLLCCVFQQLSNKHDHDTPHGNHTHTHEPLHTPMHHAPTHHTRPATTVYCRWASNRADTI